MMDREELLRGSELNFRVKVIGVMNQMVGVVNEIQETLKSKPLLELCRAQERAEDKLNWLREQVLTLEQRTHHIKPASMGSDKDAFINKGERWEDKWQKQR